MPIYICEKLASRNDYTPDFSTLRKKGHILVFNYFKKFSLDKEYSNLLRPDESHYLGKAYTATDNFVMKHGLINDDHRVLFKEDRNPPNNYSPLFKSHVKGDLYALTPEAILTLDRVMGHNFKYYREEKFVRPKEQIFPFKDSIRASVKAFVYFGIENFWENFHLHKAAVCKDATTDKWMWQ